MNYYLTFIGDILASAAIGFIVALPFIAPYHILTAKRAKNKLVTVHIITAYLFCFFISLVFSATEIPDINNFQLLIDISLTPFVINNNEQLILNILLFVPFGFLVPLLWKRFQNILRTFFLGLSFSLFIELSQLFCHRVTDIDDLITNTIGGFIGYLLFIIARLVLPKLNNIFCDNNFKKSEIYFYIAIVFITSFFLKPLMSSITAL